MTLRLKINLIVASLTLLFVAAVLALQVTNMRDSVAEETVAANRVAAQLLKRMAELHAEQGTPAMLAFLQGVGRVRSNEITLLDADGRELYRSPPSPYKSGRDAPRWFESLVTPPPGVQSIELPDGKLVVHANASRAVLDAWDNLLQLAIGSALLLVGVSALVFWQVGRAARPFGRIVDALNRMQGGRFDAALPVLPGREAGAIGAAFNRMVGELQNHIETERRAVRAETQLSDSRELSRWIDRHLEQERHLIARELHDELGQSVTAMRSVALSIAQRLAATDPHNARAARLIAEESSRLYDAMHGIIPRLTPLVLDSFGLAEALTDLAERTRRSQPGVAVELRIDLADTALPNETALALYRAAQEGITNALAHGQAQRLELTVGARAGRIELELRDDGCGLPPEGAQRSGHYGLRWLAERVQGLNGSVQLQATPPRGVSLRVSVPLPVAAPAAVPLNP